MTHQFAVLYYLAAKILIQLGHFETSSNIPIVGRFVAHPEVRLYASDTPPRPHPLISPLHTRARKQMQAQK